MADAATATAAAAAASASANDGRIDCIDCIDRIKCLDRKDVVFVSCFKSGSTSVGVALEALGYRDMSWSPSALSRHDLQVIGVLNGLMSEYERLSDVPAEVREDVCACIGGALRTAMQGHDSASDWPLGHDAIHPFLRKLVFPEAKFVFLERPEDRYVRSVEKHELKQPAGPSAVFLDVWGVAGGRLGRRIAWAQYQSWRKTYVRLHAEHPHDVLFMSVQDGWAPLCAFLGAPAPADDVPFPWENRGTATPTPLRTV